jgi:hypothetical protein
MKQNTARNSINRTARAPAAARSADQRSSHQHQATAQLVTTPTCPICRAQFTNNDELAAHTFTDHALPPLPSCPFCNKTYKKEGFWLKAHVEECSAKQQQQPSVQHQADSEVPNSLTCTICKKAYVYKNKTTLAAHMKLCPVNQQQQQLLQFQATSIPTGPLTCNICQNAFVFKNKVTLAAHMKTCPGSQKQSQNALAKPARHQGIAKLRCHLCKKPFANDKTLATHVSKFHISNCDLNELAELPFFDEDNINDLLTFVPRPSTRSSRSRQASLTTCSLSTLIFAQ